MLIRSTSVVIGLLASLAAPPSAAAASGVAPYGSDTTTGVVTMITGDRVELRGGGSPPQVTLGPGRLSVPYRLVRKAGHLHVLPADAAELIAAGRLDPRLFDVTALLESGHDDQRQPDLPLIIQYDRATAQQPALGVATAVRPLSSVHGSSVRVSKKDHQALWDSVTKPGVGKRLMRDGVDKVWLNGRRRLTLDHSVPQIGAPAAWQAGLTGSQVRVAVVDSGVDATHPDLAGKVAAAANFTDQPPGDTLGHGTHVASTIAGDGKAAGGRYRGVAPDVRLLDAKVCVDECPEDAILAGMEWAVVQQHAQVVNMSLGGMDSPEIDPIEQAVNTLSAQHGTLFVIAAGNSGPDPGTVGSPGSADAALTVGAVDRQDALAPFSGRGPRQGDGAIKPDVTAPGVGIVAARADGTQLGDVVDERYVRLSGTSMATPHVAGAAAILFQQHPDWTGDRIKALVMASAHRSGANSPFEQGAGRVDVARAIKQPVVAEPAGLNFGLAQWPHEDDQELHKTVTYRNIGPSEVTVDVSVSAPFTVSPKRLVLASGATGQVTVSADSRADSMPVGHHAGWLTATGPDMAVNTPLEIDKETERYQLDLTRIGRNGAAPGWQATYLDRLDGCGAEPCAFADFGSAGTAKLRLPPGRYLLGQFSVTAGQQDMNLLMRPLLEVKGNMSVTLDARDARPVDLAVPHRTARLMEWNLFAARDTYRPNEPLVYAVSGDHSLPLYTGSQGVAPRNDMVGFIQGRFAEPGQKGDYLDSPYEYNVGGGAAGELFTGLRLHPRQHEFATVKDTFAAVSNGPHSARTVQFARPANVRPELIDGWPPNFDAVPLDTSGAPFHRTVYYQADNLVWTTYMTEYNPVTRASNYLLGKFDRQRYQAGRTYHHTWGKGVFRPFFREPRFFPSNGVANGVVRVGDHFAAGIDMFVDAGAGHSGEPRLPFGKASLYRDGKLYSQWPTFGYVTAELPPEDAAYRLEATVEPTFSKVSTRITSVWSFRSGHVTGPQATALPLLALTYRPELDERNNARPGPRFTIPIEVTRQPGSGSPTVAALTMEVSYDDGTTWRPARVAQWAGTWYATVDNPRGGAVSLKTNVRDTAGNQLDQTVLRAYLVTG